MFLFPSGSGATLDSVLVGVVDDGLIRTNKSGAFSEETFCMQRETNGYQYKEEVVAEEWKRNG